MNSNCKSGDGIMRQARNDGSGKVGFRIMCGRTEVVSPSLMSITAYFERNGYKYGDRF